MEKCVQKMAWWQTKWNYNSKHFIPFKQHFSHIHAEKKRNYQLAFVLFQLLTVICNECVCESENLTIRWWYSGKLTVDLRQKKFGWKNMVPSFFGCLLCCWNAHTIFRIGSVSWYEWMWCKRQFYLTSGDFVSLHAILLI